MARAFRAEAVIRQPIAVVWDRLTDWESAGDWMRGVTGLKADSDSAVGTTLTHMGSRRVHESTIIHWDPPEVVQLMSERGTHRMVYSYSLDHITDSVTHLTVDAFIEVAGARKLLSPFIILALRLRHAHGAAALKDLLDPADS